MPYEHIKLAKFGLVKIQRAVKGSVRRDTYMDSFAKCGIYPYNANQIFDQIKRSGLYIIIIAEWLPDLMAAVRYPTVSCDLVALSFPATLVATKIERATQRCFDILYVV